MVDGSGEVRRQSKVAVDDPDLSVRIASIEDLKQLVREAKDYGWSATWSSEEALVQQVHAESTAVLCPLFRNGGPVDEPMSYRCHLWFVKRGPEQRSIVSFLDVSERSLLALREASEATQLKKVVRLLLDWTELGALQ